MYIPYVYINIHMRVCVYIYVYMCLHVYVLPYIHIYMYRDMYTHYSFGDKVCFRRGWSTCCPTASWHLASKAPKKTRWRLKWPWNPLVLDFPELMSRGQ